MAAGDPLFVAVDRLPIYVILVIDDPRPGSGNFRFDPPHPRTLFGARGIGTEACVILGACSGSSGRLLLPFQLSQSQALVLFSDVGVFFQSRLLLYASGRACWGSSGRLLTFLPQSRALLI